MKPIKTKCKTFRCQEPLNHGGRCSVGAATDGEITLLRRHGKLVPE